jgi:ribose/xylose/arabinose/galactoside ABC-type transport system permease subunit
MAGHHVLSATPAPWSRSRLSLLTGQVQTQAMSHAKFVFLIVLVIFFIVLFVVAYVWMRRPGFGQKGGSPNSAASRGAAPSGVPGEPRSDHVVIPVDARRMPARR